MARKASDAECRGNYEKLREMFNTIVPDAGRFEVVYACGLDVGMTDLIVVRRHTYTYSSYIVGFDTQANEIVIIPVTVEMDAYGQPIYLKNSEVRRAKQSWISKEITIQDNRLPRKYIQFSVVSHIAKDPDNVVILVKQDEESKKFQEFFKTRFKK